MRVERGRGEKGRWGERRKGSMGRAEKRVDGESGEKGRWGERRKESMGRAEKRVDGESGEKGRWGEGKGGDRERRKRDVKEMVTGDTSLWQRTTTTPGRLTIII